MNPPTVVKAQAEPAWFERAGGPWWNWWNLGGEVQKKLEL